MDEKNRVSSIKCTKCQKPALHISCRLDDRSRIRSQRSRSRRVNHRSSDRSSDRAIDRHRDLSASPRRSCDRRSHFSEPCQRARGGALRVVRRRRRASRRRGRRRSASSRRPARSWMRAALQVAPRRRSAPAPAARRGSSSSNCVSAPRSSRRACSIAAVAVPRDRIARVQRRSRVRAPSPRLRTSLLLERTPALRATAGTPRACRAFGALRSRSRRLPA